MTQTITDVHSISSAGGWFFTNLGAQAWTDLVPVACFALVSVVSENHLVLGPNKIVVPLAADTMATDLIGTNVSDDMRSIMHTNELKELGLDE